MADPNVLVAAVIGREGVCSGLVLAAAAGRYTLVASPQLLAELTAVLERPKFRRYLSLDEAYDYTRQLASLAEVIADPQRGGPPVTEDPKDDYLVALAQVASVDVLVSGDHHLTALPDDQVVVNTPSELLAKLESI